MHLDDSTSRPNLLDDRTIAVARILISSLIIVILALDPIEQTHYTRLMEVLPWLYCGYSFGLLGLLLAHARGRALLWRWTPWLDIGWYGALISVTTGTNSIFFVGFFFAILVAAFRFGFRTGLSITVAATLAYLVIGVGTAPRGQGFELNRFLVRSLFLLTLGVMMARWGELVIQLNQRLLLLNRLAQFANPRLGFDHTIATIMEQLRLFYQARQCLLVEQDATGGLFLRRAGAEAPHEGARRQPLPAELGALLLGLPSQMCALAARPRWRRPRRACFDAQAPGAVPAAGSQALIERLTAFLESENLITAPLFPALPGRRERLFLIAGCRAFDESDLDFLLQATRQLGMALENIRLVDCLASGAAEEERRRVAHDMHDTIVQPYLGLQFGLAALRQKINGDTPELARDVDRLHEMTAAGLDYLRNYVHGLRQGTDRPTMLVAALHRYIEKFSQLTGLTVDTREFSQLQIHDRLAAELFQMAVEGLSNVRRHTTATEAKLRLRQESGRLILEIENPADPAQAPFQPRSISQRTATLGGTTRVERRAQDRTVVVVEIPL